MSNNSMAFSQGVPVQAQQNPNMSQSNMFDGLGGTTNMTQQVQRQYTQMASPNAMANSQYVRNQTLMSN